MQPPPPETAESACPAADTKPEAPAVSVIVPAYNAAGTLVRGLTGVFSQTYPHIVEVIVVDDGSTDDTASLLRESFPQVKYVRQEQLGVATARNRGVAEARGDFLAFLDADDVWQPDKLARQLAVLTAQPDLALLLTQATRVFPTGQQDPPPGQGLPEVLAVTLPIWMSRQRRNALGIYACVSSWVMPRWVFSAAGVFDEAWTISSDHEYILRLLGQGQRVAMLTAPLIDYYLSSGSLSHRPDCGRYLAASQRVLQAWAATALPENGELTEAGRRVLILTELRARARILFRRGGLSACLELLREGRRFAATPAQRLDLAFRTGLVWLAVKLGGGSWSAVGRMHAGLRRLRWNARTRLGSR